MVPNVDLSAVIASFAPVLPGELPLLSTTINKTTD
jgi:hypothetical protein